MTDHIQRLTDLMKRDGYTCVLDPTNPEKCQWVPPGWEADFKIGHPCFEVNRKDQ